MDLFESYTSTSCYWAGFIAADGCLPADRPQIRIVLHKQDEEQLYKLQKLLGGQVKETSSGYMGYVLTGAYKVKKQLTERFNVVPRKSLILVPPPLVNPTYIAAYLRGLFDGDGSLSKSNQWEFCLTGTKAMMKWAKFHITGNVLQAGKPKVEAHKSISRVRFVGRQGKDILKWLYTGSMPETRLARKYTKWLEMPELKPKGIRVLSNGRWMVRKTINGQRRYLGCYNTEAEAERVYLMGGSNGIHS